VVSRAKQALPGVAKRVLSEWTSGVVSHSNARQERQRNAAKRVDIAGGTPGGDSPRALMPKDIDYRRMSDNDILNM
jgi:isopentenyldiphosphate isomerase